MKRISPRLGAGIRLQAGNARFAAETASSTSAGPEAGKTPTTSSWFAGLVLVKVAPERASTHLPPIRLRYVVVAVLDTAICLLVAQRRTARARGPVWCCG